MKITKIAIDGFGCLRDRIIVPAGGVNIIGGANESGKSTLHLFIRSMFYGVPARGKSGQKSAYERMRPWKDPGRYGGFLEIEKDGSSYRIVRDFNLAPDDLRLFEITDGAEDEMANAAETLRELLGGMSETAYVNTVSMGQLCSETRRAMADEIRSFAANFSTTVHPGLNAYRALDFLSEQRKALESRISRDAAKDYNIILGRIRSLSAQLSSPDRVNMLSETIRAGEELSEAQNEVSDLIRSDDSRMEELKAGLRDTGIDSEKDALGLRQRTSDLYSAYEESRAAVPVYIVVGLIFLALGISGFAIAFCGIFGLMERYSDQKTALVVFSAAALIFGIIVCVNAFRLKKRAAQSIAAVNDIFARLLPGEGMEVPDDDLIIRLDERLSACTDSAAELDRLRSESDELLKRFKYISEEQSSQLSELLRQRERLDLTESEMEELEDLRRRSIVLERELAENASLRDEIDAVELAADVIKELSGNIERAAGTYINAEAGRILAAVSGGAYDSVNAGMNYDITVNSPDGMIPVRELSQGAADQVYLAVRLSAVRFIAGDDDEMPLILDDSFSFYDDERLRSAVDFLAKSYKGQILILSCQQREEAILSEVGTEHLSIVL